jgi:hypothetical protein
MAASPIFPSGIAEITKTLVNADSTNWVDIYDNSAGSTPVRCECLILTSDDTATVNIQIGKLSGGTTYLLGTVRAVTLSGTDGAAARINMLNTVGVTAPDSIQVIEIAAGTKLQAKSLVAVTSAKTVTLTGWVRQYA